MIVLFVERARRRYLWNEVVAQFAWAGTLLLGGAILLLLAGTQLLDWRVILALCVLGFAIGLFRVFRRIPSLYRIAIVVDRHAGLNDALSTALYFEAPTTHAMGLTAIRQFQRAEAERLLPGVDLQAAVPFEIPRALYVMALLGLVASSLFALRYGIQRSLEFRAPLTRVVMDGLGFYAPEDQAGARAKKGGAKPRRLDTLDEQGIPLARAEQKRAGEPDAAAAAVETVADPDVNHGKTQSVAASKQGSAGGETADSDGGDKAGASQSESASGKNGPENPTGSRDGPQQGEQGASQQGGQPNSSNLLSKVREAMQNLMAKAMPQNQAGQKPNAAQGSKGQSQQARPGEKGAPGDRRNGGQQESAEGQQGQQAGDPENANNGEGKGNGQSSEQHAAAQPGSGVGKQDGAKDIKAAEQKAAMGKLSEIIGKRSANVQGEMMVESQSGFQELRTQYSRRNANHRESGGEVNRDEVPLALQPYVQQYFEEVRKRERTAAVSRKTPSQSQ